MASIVGLSMADAARGYVRAGHAMPRRNVFVSVVVKLDLLRMVVISIALERRAAIWADWLPVGEM